MSRNTRGGYRIGSTSKPAMTFPMTTTKAGTPMTAAGRRLLDWFGGPMKPGEARNLSKSILAIEAEASARADAQASLARLDLVTERAKTADVLGARDILRDWLDGHDNGYPVGPDQQWESDIAERARALLEPKP